MWVGRVLRAPARTLGTVTKTAGIFVRLEIVSVSCKLGSVLGFYCTIPFKSHDTAEAASVAVLVDTSVEQTVANSRRLVHVTGAAKLALARDPFLLMTVAGPRTLGTTSHLVAFTAIHFK